MRTDGSLQDIKRPGDTTLFQEHSEMLRTRSSLPRPPGLICWCEGQDGDLATGTEKVTVIRGSSVRVFFGCLV